MLQCKQFVSKVEEHVGHFAKVTPDVSQDVRKAFGLLKGLAHIDDDYSLAESFVVEIERAALTGARPVDLKATFYNLRQRHARQIKQMKEELKEFNKQASMFIDAWMRRHEPVMVAAA